MKIKKVTALLSALVLSAGMAAMFAADAAGTTEPEEIPEGKNYKTYCYFKNLETEGTHVLPNGYMYISKRDIPDDGMEISTELYYVDKYKCMGQLAVKATFESEEIQIHRVSKSFEKYGSVYKDEERRASFNIWEPYEEFPYHIASYMIYTISIVPIEVLTEHTDDYPLCVIDSLIAKDVASDDYELYIMPVIPFPSGGWTQSTDVKRFNDDYSLIPETNLGYTSEPTHVLISDRDLGDVDANGVVDIKDAELVLEEYTEASNRHGSFSIEKKLAADVNTDGVIDDEDANIILTYAVSGEDISFYDYLNEIS